MAAWQYADYMTLTDLTERRSRLALHIAEIDNRIAGFATTQGLQTSATRFQLDTLRQQCWDYLMQLDEALGLAPGSNIPVFVQGKPRLEQADHPIQPPYQYD